MYKKLSYRRETARRTISVYVLPNAASTFDKLHFKAFVSVNEVNVYSVPSEVTRFDRFIHMRADGPRKGHKHATYTTHRAWHTLPYTSLVVSLVVCDLLNSHLRRRGNETVEFRCVGGASWLGWRHRRRWFTKRRRTEGNKNVTSTAAGNCC